MSFEYKYLKYKLKYLKLKYDLEGGSYADNIVSLIKREQNGEKRLKIVLKMYKPFMLNIINKSDRELRNFSRENVRRWGIRPGTQIFYKGAFGTDKLQHHGVYLGNGLLCEVGGKWCKLSSSTGFLEQCLSINTLNDFVIRGKGEIYRINYKRINLDDMNVLRKQLKRALDLIEHSDWDYNPFTHNCQHWSSFVTTGKAAMNQCDLLHKGFTEEKIDLVKTKGCEHSDCKVYHMTTNGKICDTEPSRGLSGKYCYLKDGSWDYISGERKYGCMKKHKNTYSSRKKSNKHRHDKILRCIE